MIRRLFVVACVLVSATGCLPQHLYQTSAPPVEKAVKLIESHPKVKEALGEPVSVSLMVSRGFKRDFLTKQRTGIDSVRLDTTVKGPKGEAQLDLSAQNVNDQGWAGTFKVRTLGELKLDNGSYAPSGARDLVEGTFAPDGTPLVKE